MKICNKHKRYNAIFPPKCGCLDCWAMYLESKDEPTITKDFYISLINEFDKVKESMSWCHKEYSRY